MPAVHPHHESRGDTHPLPISRRRFLTRSALVVAGGGGFSFPGGGGGRAAGCLFSATGGRVVPSLSDTTPAIDTATPIKRVIYLMLENRSFDNLYGTF